MTAHPTTTDRAQSGDRRVASAPVAPDPKAIALYELGWSVSRLADAYGLTAPGMRKRLIRWGVTLRTHAEQLRLDAARRRDERDRPDR
jgi:hypothetical protein